MSIGDLGVDTTKALNYTKFELPPARSGETTFVEDVATLEKRKGSIRHG
jgi:hypothetical protein